MEQTILSISGKPGLYKLVSRGKANLIVESIDQQHKRMPVFASDRVTSLRAIATYTDAEHRPLTKVFANLLKVEEGKPASINYKKCKSAELREYFATILPDYDRDRVHDSDIKKLLQWYNLLVNNGITDFEEPEAEEEEKNEAEG